MVGRDYNKRKVGGAGTIEIPGGYVLERKKIRYRDLSIPLKIVVCFMYFWMIMFGFSFVIGFISALLSVS